jgi:metal-responsive CopG/Arc/MetJ family transcriptional regulator
MKKRVTYYLSTDLIEKLKEIPRNELPNISKLVEELLEKFIEKREKTMDKKMSKS